MVGTTAFGHTGVYYIFDDACGDPSAEEHMKDVLYQVGRTIRLTLLYTH